MAFLCKSSVYSPAGFGDIRTRGRSKVTSLKKKKKRFYYLKFPELSLDVTRTKNMCLQMKRNQYLPSCKAAQQTESNRETIKCTFSSHKM